MLKKLLVEKLLEKLIYVLKKPNIRRKMRILNSLMALKNLKGEPFGIFQHPLCYKVSKKLKEGPCEDIKKFSSEVSQSRKRGKSHSAKKVEKGDFSGSTCKRIEKKRSEKQISEKQILHYF